MRRVLRVTYELPRREPSSRKNTAIVLSECGRTRRKVFAFLTEREAIVGASIIRDRDHSAALHRDGAEHVAVAPMSPNHRPANGLAQGGSEHDITQEVPVVDES
jgi:hypothetical protein